MRKLTSSVLTLLLLVGWSNAAVAQSAASKNSARPSSSSAATKRRLYRPPNASQAKGEITTSARRGAACTPKTNSSLTAIAPQTHVGQSLSDQPTLVWHVPDEDSFPIRVELLAYNSDAVDRFESTSMVKETLQSQPGLMSWTVPEASRLEPGQRYWWRVIMFCNVNRPLDSVEITADLQLGDINGDAEAALSGAAPFQRAEQLAQSGYWYDAMGLLVNQTNPAAAALRQEMVQSLLELHQTVEPTTALVRYGTQLEELLQVGL